MKSVVSSLLFLLLCTSAARAEVRFSWNRMTFSGTVTDEDMRKADRQYRKRLYQTSELAISVLAVDRETLRRLVSHYPSVPHVEVSDCVWLRDVSLFAPLKDLRSLSVIVASSPQMRRQARPLDIRGLEAFPQLESFAVRGLPVADLAPVGACASLGHLRFQETRLPDLSPLSRLEKISEIDFSGSTLRNLSPLAEMPALESLNLYRVSLTDGAWSDLGRMPRLRSVRTGLTTMTSLDWVRQVPGLASLELFAEAVQDYSPLAAAKRLTRFSATGMRGLVNLSFVKGCPRLDSVTLAGSPVARLEELRDVPALRVLRLTDLAPCDLAFASALVNLEELSVSRSRVTSFDAVKGLPRLRLLDAVALPSGTQISLKGLETCRSLAEVRVSRGAFSGRERDDLAHACQKNVTAFRIVEK